MQPDAPPLTARRSAFLTLLVTEAAERAGFYGMEAILLLFMVQQLGMADMGADLLVGAFAAMIYATPLLGGWLGDRVYGARRTVVLGSILLSAGYGLLALSTVYRTLFEPALALAATGNGLFKPNAAQLIRCLYEDQPQERDSAFTLYYMAANVGSALSMLCIPWVRDHAGSLTAFGLCVAGPACALLILLSRTRALHLTGSAPDYAPLQFRSAAVGAGAIALCALAVMAVLSSASFARLAVLGCLALVALLWVALYRRAASRERLNLVTMGVMLLQSIAFYCFYQQMQTSLTLFALTHVDGTFRLAGHALFTLSAAQFQALDPIFIILLSPLLAKLYHALASRDRDFSLPTKFAAGFGFVALAFFIWWGGTYLAGPGLTSAWPMLGGYFALATAELLIGGLGLAVIARYAPARLNGLMVGAYYLTVGAGMYLGSEIASLASPPATAVPLHNHHYETLFGILCLCGFGLVSVALLLARMLNTLEDRHQARV
ncbi:peptide MFS transporter [Acetobacter persici]|uniref:peptide MFS transporter n=1 Tax=Acetobacter persici TaxID=1076596 RepID=UPI001EEDDEBC|nr:oligopeptide:H+ symporter [Acetobacter persici]